MTNTFERMQRDLSLLAQSGKIAQPDAHTPIEPDPDAILTFVFWGDPQIARWSALRSARLTSACLDLANMKKPVDALVVAGDIAEHGASEEYAMTAQILASCAGAYRHFLCVPGNHDIRMRAYAKQMDAFKQFVRGVSGGLVASDPYYYFAARIRGYKFLLMGSDRATFEGAYISARQLRWLDAQIAAENGKPVFVVNHQTLKRTNGLPVTWLGKGNWRGSVGNESDKLRAVFEKHRNVIFLTGHLHYGTSEYSYEDHGAYKALAAQTVGVVNHGSCTDDTQGYVVSVYADHIEARARVFGEGRYVDPSIPNAYIQIPIE